MEGKQGTAQDSTPVEVKRKKLAKNYTDEELKDACSKALESFIHINRYLENAEELVSFGEWLDRKNHLWMMFTHFPSRGSRGCFKQLIRQGINSLAHQLSLIETEGLKAEAAEKDYNALPGLDPVEYFWTSDHACGKWVSSLCSLLGKSVYESRFVEELTEAMKDKVMVPYLKLGLELGLNIDDLGNLSLIEMTQRRFPNDMSSTSRFIELVRTRVRVDVQSTVL